MPVFVDGYIQFLHRNKRLQLQVLNLTYLKRNLCRKRSLVLDFYLFGPKLISCLLIIFNNRELRVPNFYITYARTRFQHSYFANFSLSCTINLIKTYMVSNVNNNYVTKK